ncbi:SRPBCC domain-containing protein [Pedobacter sp. FW305-3-2-15-E-R2A2]|uniref:SRPBCC domain-containing protein n=1 Tax=Pedobacter sp. FW305-3-2-15-E-R2A2 TaxID=3140251 RepID=UPI0031404C5B
MTKEIKTEILINARPESVWAILTAFDQYPNWNPFIKSISGDQAVGTQLVVRIEPPEATGMTFKPKVLAFEANKEFRWIGHLLFSGLFDGEHKFELIDHGNGTTTFIQSEKFKGILVSLFAKQLDNNTRRGFMEMNVKLKALAERS